MPSSKTKSKKSTTVTKTNNPPIQSANTADSDDWWNDSALNSEEEKIVDLAKKDRATAELLGETPMSKSAKKRASAAKRKKSLMKNNLNENVNIVNGTVTGTESSNSLIVDGLGESEIIINQSSSDNLNAVVNPVSIFKDTVTSDQPKISESEGPRTSTTTTNTTGPSKKKRNTKKKSSIVLEGPDNNNINATDAGIAGSQGAAAAHTKRKSQAKLRREMSRQMAREGSKTSVSLDDSTTNLSISENPSHAMTVSTAASESQSQSQFQNLSNGDSAVTANGTSPSESEAIKLDSMVTAISESTTSAAVAPIIKAEATAETVVNTVTESIPEPKIESTEKRLATEVHALAEVTDTTKATEPEEKKSEPIVELTSNDNVTKPAPETSAPETAISESISTTVNIKSESVTDTTTDSKESKSSTSSTLSQENKTAHSPQQSQPTKSEPVPSPSQSKESSANLSDISIDIPAISSTLGRETVQVPLGQSNLNNNCNESAAKSNVNVNESAPKTQSQSQVTNSTLLNTTSEAPSTTTKSTISTAKPKSTGPLGSPVTVTSNNTSSSAISKDNKAIDDMAMTDKEKQMAERKNKKGIFACFCWS